MGIFSTFSGRYSIVMSKTEGQTFRNRFGNETKTFWYRSRICLVENRLFRSCLKSALLDQIEMCSFDGADSGTNSDVLVSFVLDVGTFEECLLNVCSFTVLTWPNPQYPHSQKLTSAIIKFILLHILVQYCTTKQILVLYYFIILMYIFLIFIFILVSSVKNLTILG